MITRTILLLSILVSISIYVVSQNFPTSLRYVWKFFHNLLHRGKALPMRRANALSLDGFQVSFSSIALHDVNFAVGRKQKLFASTSFPALRHHQAMRYNIFVFVHEKHGKYCLVSFPKRRQPALFLNDQLGETSITNKTC